MRRLVVEFTKMSGAGNDFIVIDNRFYHFNSVELSSLALRYAPRRTGIGADGLLALESSDTEGVDFRMRYLNADGSVGTMCGNGARCLALYARSAGLESQPLIFDTDAGRYEAYVDVDPSADVRLVLGPHADYGKRDLAAMDGLPGEAHYIWTGTEHVVVFVPDVDQAPVAETGPVLRADPAISSTGANVNYVEVTGRAALRVRTFEKGVEAETLACGTGATASAIVACLSGRIAAGRVEVNMPGGRLVVDIQGDPRFPDRLVLEGPAEVVFRGSFEW